jgi:hypothetical protein
VVPCISCRHPCKMNDPFCTNCGTKFGHGAGGTKPQGSYGPAGGFGARPQAGGFNAQTHSNSPTILGSVNVYLPFQPTVPAQAPAGCTTLFVGGLPLSGASIYFGQLCDLQSLSTSFKGVTTDHVKDLFSSFGEILGIRESFRKVMQLL